MATTMDRREGRALFGGDPLGYERARPDYPERVYALLEERCNLAPGCRTLEIGPGSGSVTRRLLALGAEPLVAVEPDTRFAAALAEVAALWPARVEIVHEPFERAAVRPAELDLIVEATSFHWIEPKAGLARVARLLAPGGWLAMWWHVFGDPRREDPFHDATAPLLEALERSPSQPSGAPLPFSLDRAAREAELDRVGAFDEIFFDEIPWTSTQTPAEVRALYATFSAINRLEEAARAELLDALEEIAERRFGGRVVRRFVVPIYLARRGPGALRPDVARR